MMFAYYAVAQCPAGQTEITLEINAPNFGGEVGWELVDATTGMVIACQPAGTYATGSVTIEGPFCVIDGNTIVFTGYDSFGDDWNGGFVNITITEDGSVNGCAAQDGCVVVQNGGQDVDVEPDISITNSCETSNEEFIITLPVFACDATPISGCTDPAAPNFNACATIDDGTCPPPAPANDLCATATPLACGDALVGETSASSTDQSADVGCAMGTGVWYSFVGDGNLIALDITNDSFDAEIAIATAASCAGPFTNVSCTDGGTTAESVLFPSVAGTTYYIYVGDFATAGTDGGTFDIAITSCAPPPPGNECSDPIPYPGDVEAGTCVTGFDFTPFTDSGMPSPTCDFGGDAVAWFSWTAPIVTAAGDPIDLIFDDGDGQASDCNIGIEAYETDCTTPASNCLSNVSGNLTGLTQGTDYVLLIYQDSPAADNCDFCLTIACSSPIVAATAVCQTGDESGFYVEVNVTNIGVGNTAYTVDVGGPQANITATGITTYGPFPSGTPIDVVLTGVDDATCGFTLIGLDKDCTCPPDLALAGPAGPYCTTDAAVAITFAPTGPFPSSVTITNTADGAFDGEVGFGLYAGTWDDGIALGLPPAGTGLFGTDTETSLEGAIPNDGTGNPDVTTAGNFGGDPLVPGFAQTVTLPPGDYTIYLVDDFGDGWNGTQAIVTDECGNVITTEQIIEDIAGDIQDEVAWVNFTLPIQPPVVTVAGNGVVQTADPDGMPNSGDETYEFDPSQVAAVGCDPVTETLTLTTDICGVICEETIDVQVFPPAQAPTVTRDDDVCNYTISPACAGDLLDMTTATAAPGEDPAAIDVNVTTADGCMATFPVDPPACPMIGAVCQGIDLAAGLPVVPTEVCSGATADICLTLIDAAEGLVVTGTIDGAPVTLSGVAGANPNELCVTITASTNETCAPIDVVIQIDAITCTDGTDYPGILGGATLVDDLTTAGLNPLNVPVYPTLTVNTMGDGTCGMLSAELVAADGTICATAVGSPFACSADGETFDYDFTGDPALADFTAVPADCPLPTLSGTLTCGNCDGASCTLMAPACNACPDPTCEASTVIDLMTGMELNDAQEFSGAVPAVIPNYDISTNMGTLTLPAGGDQIFAVSGVTGLMLPNNISEVCLTMDINVISGEIPFLFEFRLENGIPGQQLQFNAMVDGLGMCSVGGNFADAVPAAGFTFVNGASYTVAAAIADFDGTPVSEDLVVEISNIMLTVCAPDPAISGCTDPAFDNFDPNAVCDDGSCANEPTCPMCGACETPNELPFAEIGGGDPEFSFAGADAFDDGNAMGIFAGGNNTFAGHGWFIDQSAIPAGAVIEDYCIFGDFNVIADAADLPITIEFRIENNGVGTFIEFNTVVTMPGSITIGGNLSTGTEVPPFDINGTVPTLVVAIAVPGLSGTPPPAGDIIVEYSNVYITDGTCNPVTVETPAAPTVTDSTCPDGMTLIPGSIDYSATTCANAGDVLEYSLDGGTTWSTTQPTYADVEAAAMGNTLDVRCECGGNASAPVQVVINPGVCTALCQGIDLGAGLPVVPTEVCSGATADICLTLIDAAEGLVVTGTIDGVAVSLTGMASGNPNELCVSITAPINETCDVTNVIIQIDAIQCTDGTDYPGILGGATLLDDLTDAGLNPLNVPVYPTLSISTSADGTCGNLTAELIATDGSVCATAADSPFACAADGETLDYDFTGDAALANFIAVPVDCPLPTLSGTLTCGNCAAPCDGLAADPGIVSPIELCDGDGPIDLCFLMVDATQGLNFDINIDGAPAGVIAGTPGANPNELCIQLPQVANQTCDFISFNITFNAITCDNGDAIAGPASPSLADDLNAGGGITINVYPTLAVNTAGDGACGDLTAELVAADGTICATAAGSPFTCTANGDVLNYDFSGDVTFTPPAACLLPTLISTLTCSSCGPCEDAITGTVTTDEPTCDLAGTMVEILDSNGIPVAGSPVTIDAMGNYTLPGPFPCGTYTAEIVVGSAPQCYYELSGDEGPFQFEVDGDGEADGVNFSTQPQVPTLSQWGLITLTLLLMSFGAIKLVYRKEQIPDFIK